MSIQNTLDDTTDFLGKGSKKAEPYDRYKWSAFNSTYRGEIKKPSYTCIFGHL